MNIVHSKSSNESDGVSIGNLHQGYTGPLIVMLCRRWDPMHLNQAWFVLVVVICKLEFIILMLTLAPYKPH
jgi:hypothetical protein